jgi:hypothetical protein
MAALPPDIDFRLDKSASPERMNRAMAAIDGRLKSLETYRPNLDALLLELQRIGLERVSTAVVPIVERLAAIQSLGFLNAPIEEGTTARFQIGPVSVTIAADRRAFFTPAPWVAMLSDANPNDYVLGKTVSYDQATGLLEINITNLWGTISVFSDVTVWGVAGAALSTIESAATAAADRTASQIAAAGAASSATVAINAATTATTQAGNAAASASVAGSSAAAAAAIAANLSGTVTSVNGKTAIVVLGASDVGAYSKPQIDAMLDPGVF